MLMFNTDNSRAAVERTISLKYHDKIILVSLRRAPTAKRFILRVRLAMRDAVLTMPKRASLRDAQDFAERNAAWLYSRLQGLPEIIPFAHGSVIPLRGDDHIIERKNNNRGVVWIEGSENDQSLKKLCVVGHDAHIHRRIADYLKKQARNDLEDAVSKHARALSLAPRKISLRDPISRWGSCSASGTLNFSWRLIFSPPFVLDYLAAHEVAHLMHLDHSPQFWALTRQLCSTVDQSESWLTKHGVQLHKFGVKS